MTQDNRQRKAITHMFATKSTSVPARGSIKPSSDVSENTYTVQSQYLVLDLSYELSLQARGVNSNGSGPPLTLTLTLEFTLV